MPAISSQETVLSVSTVANEPITVTLESGTAVTIRVQVDNACACQTAATPQVGSYIDKDVTTPAALRS